MAGVPTFVRIYRAALSGSSCRAAPLPNPPISRPLQLARPMSMVPNIPGIPGPPINSSGSISPSGLPVHSEAKMVSGREGVTASGLSLSLQHLLAGGFSPFPRSQSSSRIFRAGDATRNVRAPELCPQPSVGLRFPGMELGLGQAEPGEQRLDCKSEILGLALLSNPLTGT